ncbi:hypothetical protein [Bradyrhizobium sp.]|uniref:hypothetical protein n=1 Tax=Bradyrhizobium sp. TaxID=376 RepID=UPI0025C1855B|nr:hypothetical protein [Bradyrhizobium sp.]
MPNRKSPPKRPREKPPSVGVDTTAKLDALPELVVDAADLPASAADLSRRLSDQARQERRRMLDPAAQRS